SNATIASTSAPRAQQPVDEWGLATVAKQVESGAGAQQQQQAATFLFDLLAPNAAMDSNSQATANATFSDTVSTDLLSLSPLSTPLSYATTQQSATRKDRMKMCLAKTGKLTSIASNPPLENVRGYTIREHAVKDSGSNRGIRRGMMDSDAKVAFQTNNTVCLPAEFVVVDGACTCGYLVGVQHSDWKKLLPNHPAVREGLLLPDLKELTVLLIEHPDGQFDLLGRITRLDRTIDPLSGRELQSLIIPRSFTAVFNYIAHPSNSKYRQAVKSQHWNVFFYRPEAGIELWKLKKRLLICTTETLIGTPTGGRLHG
ncbi:hypothetical protein FRB90_012116, partial [Tulasnella sp. 427]